MKLNKRGAFEKQIKEALPQKPQPVYLINSKDDNERKAAWESLRAQLLAGNAGLSSFYPDKCEASHVMEELQSLSFFHDATVVFIEQIDKARKELTDGLIKYLNSPNPRSVLVLSASGLRSNSPLYQRCEKLGLVLDIPEEKPWEKERHLRDQLIDWAAKEGKRIAPDAAALLVQQIGPVADSLKGELEKLICYIGDRKQITQADICMIGIAVPQENIWALGTAIFRRQGGVALRVAANLMEQGMALQQVLRNIRVQFQTEFQVCSILQNGGSPNDIMKHFPYMRGKILETHVQQAQNYGMARFKRGLLAIDAADLKVRNSDIAAETCINMLLARLTA